MLSLDRSVVKASTVTSTMALIGPSRPRTPLVRGGLKCATSEALEWFVPPMRRVVGGLQLPSVIRAA